MIAFHGPENNIQSRQLSSWNTSSRRQSRETLKSTTAIQENNTTWGTRRLKMIFDVLPKSHRAGHGKCHETPTERRQRDCRFIAPEWSPPSKSWRTKSGLKDKIGALPAE